MPFYRIELASSAIRQLESLSRKVQVRIAGKIDALTSDARPSGCSKLKDYKDIYRIRVGEYRVLFQVKDEVLLILVVKVGKRGEIYKR